MILQMWFFNLPKDLRNKIAVYIYISIWMEQCCLAEAADTKNTNNSGCFGYDAFVTFTFSSMFSIFLNENVKRMSEPSRHYTRTCRCTPTATSVTRSKTVLTSRPQHFFSAAGAKTKKLELFCFTEARRQKKGTKITCHRLITQGLHCCFGSTRTIGTLGYQLQTLVLAPH